MKVNTVNAILILLILNACATKKEIQYLQDADTNTNINTISYQSPTIQPNDILNISVETLIPEAAKPYNKNNEGNLAGNSQSLLLQGYLVSTKSTINFPLLGELNVAKKTTVDLEKDITNRLVEGDHLINPIVNVRLINAKVTILGEVKNPGTYNFNEQNITFLQALGYAGDLTINGKRKDILISREADGVRKIARIDLTSTEFINSEFYYIKPNDVIVVDPNGPKIKSAGYIGNLGTVISVVTSALALILLLRNN